MKKCICAAAALAIITGSQVVTAQAGDNFNIGGSFGVGALLGPPSTGVGITGSYWFTNNFGLSALATVEYDDYSEYGVRLDYLFNVDQWGKARIRPFVGAGFSFIDGPSGHLSGPYHATSYDVDGQGVVLHGGILHQAYYLSDHLFFSAAAVYHAFDVDASYSNTSYYYGRPGWRTTYSHSVDWTEFGIEFGIQYFF